MKHAAYHLRGKSMPPEVNQIPPTASEVATCHQPEVKTAKPPHRCHLAAQLLRGKKLAFYQLRGKTCQLPAQE